MCTEPWQSFYSQGGVKFPTGGKFARFVLANKPASACRFDRVKQIWCDSRADGYSPDGREYPLQGQPLLPIDMT